ncbi:NAD-dependent epimerase/dehydratase family protein [Leifsonia sp. YIM 134122]|uniref:NAD-dependent epimerase/dehydratase family protein n=1 Tax=Leifsonia stereocauli TaxID=3134136 RepID=A0ABU9W6K3_9MICO
MSARPVVVAVVGASGFVGAAIAEAFRDGGQEVVSIVAPRILGESRPLSEHIAVAESLALSRPTLISSLRGADVVINAAGLARPDSQATSALFGANALLPLVLFIAAKLAGVRRFVHISSIAVQGNHNPLDASRRVFPFSPYSESKAMGETLLLKAADSDTQLPKLSIVRASSVHDETRETTQRLISFARSPFASVPGRGLSPSPVSSLNGLAVCVAGVALGEPSEITVQPWEGETVFDVLARYGGKPPRRLPAWVCRTVLTVANRVARWTNNSAFQGSARRLEVLWYGQSIVAVSDGEAQEQ